MDRSLPWLPPHIIYQYYEDYILSSHGHLGENKFIQVPRNVRFIVLCSEGENHTSSVVNSWYNLQEFTPNLNALVDPNISYYRKVNGRRVGPKITRQLCVIDGDLNDSIADLTLDFNVQYDEPFLSGLFRITPEPLVNSKGIPITNIDDSLNNHWNYYDMYPNGHAPDRLIKMKQGWLPKNDGSYKISDLINANMNVFNTYRGVKFTIVIYACTNSMANVTWIGSTSMRSLNTYKNYLQTSPNPYGPSKHIVKTHLLQLKHPPPDLPLKKKLIQAAVPTHYVMEVPPAAVATAAAAAGPPAALSAAAAAGLDAVPDGEMYDYDSPSAAGFGAVSYPGGGLMVNRYQDRYKRYKMKYLYLKYLYDSMRNTNTPR